MTVKETPDFFESLLQDLPQELVQFKDSIKQHMRMQLQAKLHDMQFVSWDDFAALRALANQLSEELAQAEARLEVLEKHQGKSPVRAKKKASGQTKQSLGEQDD